jgi:hypothetical protein
VSLLAEVLGALAGAGIRAALIGGEALALRGASRATADSDLLTADERVLQSHLWKALERAGAKVEVRHGDADDPLKGVVVFRAEGERPVDLIVGRHRWQEEIVRRAEPMEFDGAQMAVPGAADLILLKLYAGGPQDAWDVAQLLATGERAALAAEVERHLPELPAECRTLWRSIRAG